MLRVCACVCTCVCSTAYGDQRTTFRNWFSSLPPRTDPGIEFRLSVCDRCLYPLSYPTCLLTFWGINFATLTREELPLRPTCFDVGFSVFWQDSLALAYSSLEWALSLRHLAFLCWWWRRAFRSPPKWYWALRGCGLELSWALGFRCLSVLCWTTVPQLAQTLAAIISTLVLWLQRQTQTFGVTPPLCTDLSSFTGPRPGHTPWCACLQGGLHQVPWSAGLIHLSAFLLVVSSFLFIWGLCISLTWF